VGESAKIMFYFGIMSFISSVMCLYEAI